MTLPGAASEAQPGPWPGLWWLAARLADCPEIARGEAPAGMLAGSELDQLARLRLDKRRRDWLLGRFAAKELVRAVLGAELGRPIPAAAVRVHPDGRGVPRVLLESHAGEPLPWSLSISHSGDEALCALGTCLEARVGIDVEGIEPRSARFVQDYFTPTEQEALRARSGAEHAELATLIWSGKEAVLKALGLGLRVDARQVECLPASGGATAGWRPLRLGCAPELLEPAGGPAGRPALRGWWISAGGRARTLALAVGNEPLLDCGWRRRGLAHVPVHAISQPARRSRGHAAAPAPAGRRPPPPPRRGI